MLLDGKRRTDIRVLTALKSERLAIGQKVKGNITAAQAFMLTEEDGFSASNKPPVMPMRR
jgi:hypothetical protein